MNRSFTFHRKLGFAEETVDIKDDNFIAAMYISSILRNVLVVFHFRRHRTLFLIRINYCRWIKKIGV